MTAAAAAFVLAVGVGAVAVGVGDDDDGAAGGGETAAQTTTTTTTEPTSTTAEPEDGETSTTEADPLGMGAAVAELSAFVSEERQLEFRQDVAVELLDGEAFDARLFEDAAEDRADVEESERVLKALQLLPPDVDLFDTVTSFLGDSTLGFYDPDTDELVVRGAELTPYVRSTLVHELVHALDDQHFELSRSALADAEDESFTGFQALYEGNAVRVQEAWEATLSDEEREQLAEEEVEFGSSIDFSNVPAILPDLLSFPYVFGPTFARALAEDGGEVRVDDALREPPLSTEQILHPERYLDGEPVASVEAPPAGGDVIDEGAYGEWVLLLTLAQELPSPDAVEAADGWGGDAYVAWDDGDRTCLRAAFAMDTGADLDELESAWQRWAEAHGDATVERAGERVTVTACG